MFEVSNQPPPLEPYNLFTSDTVLRAAVKREQAGWADDGLSALGATLGKPETIQLGIESLKEQPVPQDWLSGFSGSTVSNDGLLTATTSAQAGAAMVPAGHSSLRPRIPVRTCCHFTSRT